MEEVARPVIAQLGEETVLHGKHSLTAWIDVTSGQPAKLCLPE